MDTNNPQYDFDDDPEFAELIAMFVDELSDRVDAIERALDLGDATALKRLAHQMKGSAGGYGFNRLSALAAVVETRCAEGADTATLQEPTQRLIGECLEAQRAQAAQA